MPSSPPRKTPRQAVKQSTKAKVSRGNKSNQQYGDHPVAAITESGDVNVAPPNYRDEDAVPWRIVKLLLDGRDREIKELTRQVEWWHEEAKAAREQLTNSKKPQ